MRTLFLAGGVRRAEFPWVCGDCSTAAVTLCCKMRSVPDSCSQHRGLYRNEGVTNIRNRLVGSTNSSLLWELLIRWNIRDAAVSTELIKR